MATNYNPFAKKHAEIVNGKIENYLDATIVTHYDKTTCSYMAHVWLENQPVPIMSASAASKIAREDFISTIRDTAILYRMTKPKGKPS